MRLNHILVVDDSEADQFLARSIIRRFDAEIQVTEAPDGEAALSILASASTPPDLILLDVNMPAMDGHDFLAAYSKHDTTPSTVVMLTSSSQPRDIDRALAYDFVAGSLVKPLSVDDLKALASQ